MAACSLFNAPDDVVPPGGMGAGGGGAATSSTTTSSAGGGGTGGVEEGGGGMGGAPPAVCGDGVLAGAEACDDGNVAAGDACSATCEPVVFDVAADAGMGLLHEGPDVGSSGVDGGKGFAVVWRENHAGAYSIRSATYAANGLPAGAPGTLFGPTDSLDPPRLGSNAVHRSVVAWRGMSDNTLRVHGLNPDGTPLAGGPQLIPASQSLAISDVAAKSSGELCLVWLAPSGAINVKARCTDPEGSIASSVTQSIGSGTTAGTPGLWSAGDRFIAAWNEAAGTDILKARTLNAAGVPQGMTFLLAGNGHLNLSPAGTPVGPIGHVAIFEQVFGTGASTYTRMTKREFQAPDASSVLDSFVSSSADHDEEGATVVAAHGQFVVAWTDNDVGSGDILAQVFDGRGMKVGPPIQVNQTAPDGTQRLAKVAANEDGDVMFVWQSEHAGLLKVSALISPRLLAR